MKNIYQKLAVATAGVSVVVLGIGGTIEPSQAAAFTFAFSSNQDSLFFDENESNLTGVGLETATLSQLPDASFSFSYTSGLPLGGGGPQTASGFRLSNPTFEFNNGNLIGIDGSSSVSIDVSDTRPTSPSRTVGTATLSLTGARFAESLDALSTGFNQLGQIISQRQIDITYNTGNISFQTLAPVVRRVSVPESSSPLAFSAVLLTGLVLKRQLKKQST